MMALRALILISLCGYMLGCSSGGPSAKGSGNKSAKLTKEEVQYFKQGLQGVYEDQFETKLMAKLIVKNRLSVSELSALDKLLIKKCEADLCWLLDTKRGGE